MKNTNVVSHLHDFSGVSVSVMAKECFITLITIKLPSSRANVLLIFQTAPFSRPLSTRRALQFLSMCLQMTVQVFFICEAPLTLKTCERFLSSMKPRVKPKAYVLTETLSTVSAGEGFLSSVDSHVNLKVSFKSETLSTVMARESLLRMNSLIEVKTIESGGKISLWNKCFHYFMLAAIIGTQLLQCPFPRVTALSFLL